MNRRKIGLILSLALIASSSTYNVSAATIASTALLPAAITVNNYIGTSNDNIVITGLSASDKVNIYSVSTGGSPIISVVATESSASVSTTMLKATGGTIYVSITNTGKSESKRASKVYTSEVSKSLLTSAVVVNNNYGSENDSIVVSNLSSKDEINVYTAATGGTPIASGAVGDAGTSVEIKTTGLKSTSGTAYISVKNENKSESKRTAITYKSEPITASMAASEITVTNDVGTTKDSILITDLDEGDIVNIYSASTGGRPIASSEPVTNGQTSVTIMTSGLKTTNGTIYISIKSLNQLESKRVAKTYSSEISMGVTAKSISVENNYGTSNDSIIVDGLNEGDVIKIYSTVTGGKILASGVATSDSMEIQTTDLKATGGSIYVTVTTKDKAESKRVAARYTTEPVTNTLTKDDIVVTNDSGTSEDTIEIYANGWASDDVINVYDASVNGNLIASQTVGSASEIIMKTDGLKAKGGTVYVSVKSQNKLESKRIAKTYSSEYSQALVSSKISVNNIYLTENDSVVVTGLNAKDIINIYSTASGGTAIATGTVPDNATSVTIASSQLLISKGGTIYVSVINEDKAESKRVAKKYVSEPVSNALSSASIEVVNYLDMDNDSMEVVGLTSGDIVNVYSSAVSSETAITSATVSEGATSVVIKGYKLNLNSNGGTIYVGVKSLNKLESKRMPKTYSSETTTSLAANQIKVNNNYLTANDSILVTGVIAGDIISVYLGAKDESPVHYTTVATNATSVTIITDKLTATGGTIYVSVKKNNKAESAKVTKTYESEPFSTAVPISNIVVDNRYGSDKDDIIVTNVAAESVINVYSAASGGTAIETGIVPTNATSVTIKTDKLVSTGGTIYVSVANKNKDESKRTAKKYDTETVSDVIKAEDIIISNIEGTSKDSITVNNLNVGDTIYVYSAATSGEVVASSVVATGATSVTITAAIKGQLLNDAAGTVYVSRKSENKLEGKRVSKAYASEITTALTAASVKVNNSYGTSGDTITITGVTSGDTINVYPSASGTTALCFVTVATDATSAIITTDKLTSTGGSIYVSVKSINKDESSRVTVKYDSEPVSTALSFNSITISNKYGKNDTVLVTSLESGDVVKVYSAATGDNLIASGIVETGATSVTVSVGNLTSAGGTLYLSVARANKLESTKISKAYDTEISALTSSAVVVTNDYLTTSDSIVVNGLVEGDVVNVYSDATSTTPLVTGGVANGATSATITQAMLNGAGITFDQAGGTEYLSVIRKDKAESARISKTYAAEPVSTAPSASAITVSNNYGYADDTVVVTGLSSGDTINVYSMASNGIALASGVVSNGSTSVTVNIEKLALNTTGGSIYVSLKNANKLESTSRTKVSYTSETSAALTASDVIIYNDYMTGSDTITLKGVVAGDIVNFYSAATGGIAFTLDPIVGESPVTIAASQLSAAGIDLTPAGGTIYASIIRKDKAESSRVAVTYGAEPTSSPLPTAAITVNNNADLDNDSIEVSDLTSGDIVYVYSAATGGSPIEESTPVASGLSSVTISTKNLSSSGGSIYVSIKNADKLESATRTLKTYRAE